MIYSWLRSGAFLPFPGLSFVAQFRTFPNKPLLAFTANLVVPFIVGIPGQGFLLTIILRQSQFWLNPLLGACIHWCFLGTITPWLLYGKLIRRWRVHLTTSWTADRDQLNLFLCKLDIQHCRCSAALSVPTYRIFYMNILIDHHVRSAVPIFFIHITNEKVTRWHPDKMLRSFSTMVIWRTRRVSRPPLFVTRNCIYE